MRGSLLLALGLCLGTLRSAIAEEIRGKVVNARGNSVRIRVSGELVPRVGDTLELFHVQDVDDEEQPGSPVGRGTVLGVQDDFVQARIEEGASEPLARGQTVTIKSAKPETLDAESRRHDPLSGAPPTEEQAQELTAAIQTDLLKGRHDALLDVVDLDAIQARMLDSIELSDSMKRVYAWMIDRFFPEMDLILQYGTAKEPLPGVLLRFESTRGESTLTFRFIARDGGVYFLRLLLLRSTSGAIRIIDVCRIEQGSWLSEVMRAVMVPRKSTLAKLNQLLGPTPADLGVGLEEEPLPTLMAISRRGEYADVMSWFDDHEDELTTSKIAHVHRVVASAHYDPEVVPDIVAEAEKAFPGDVCIAWASMNALDQAKKPDLAMKACDQLEKALGGDAYADVLRSKFHAQAGRRTEALVCARRASRAEPTLCEAWRAQFSLALQDKDFAEGTRILTAMGDNGLGVENLGKLDRLDDFLGSDEYKAWLAGRGK